MSFSFKQQSSFSMKGGVLKNGSIKLKGDQSLSMNEASMRLMRGLRGEKKGFHE